MFNLKNRPRTHYVEVLKSLGYTETANDLERWFVGFEKELREVIKIYHPARGEVALAKEILGEGEKE